MRHSFSMTLIYKLLKFTCLRDLQALEIYIKSCETQKKSAFCGIRAFSALLLTTPGKLFRVRQVIFRMNIFVKNFQKRVFRKFSQERIFRKVFSGKFFQNTDVPGKDTPFLRKTVITDKSVPPAFGRDFDVSPVSSKT